MNTRTLVASDDWIESTATVLSSDLRHARLRDLDLEAEVDGSRFKIAFAYGVHGKDYYGSFEQYESMPEGAGLPLLYNPKNPQQNTLGEIPRTLRWRRAVWIAGGCIALLLIYLSIRFGWSLG